MFDVPHRGGLLDGHGERRNSKTEFERGGPPLKRNRSVRRPVKENSRRGMEKVKARVLHQINKAKGQAPKPEMSGSGGRGIGKDHPLPMDTATEKNITGTLENLGKKFGGGKLGAVQLETKGRGVPHWRERVTKDRYPTRKF